MNLAIRVEPGDSLDHVLKTFRKKLENSGAWYDIKRASERHIKRGDRRRIKRNRARKRAKKFTAKLHAS